MLRDRISAVRGIVAAIKTVLSRYQLPVLGLRNLHIFVISNCRLLCQQERVSINGELKNSIFYLFSLYVY